MKSTSTTRQPKHYPFNGPPVEEQVTMVYHWKARQEAVALVRKWKEKRPS